jgi:glycosyltransferase involved in cell wall biosynthesis
VTSNGQKPLAQQPGAPAMRKQPGPPSGKASTNVGRDSEFEAYLLATSLYRKTLELENKCNKLSLHLEGMKKSIDRIDNNSTYSVKRVTLWLLRKAVLKLKYTISGPARIFRSRDVWDKAKRAGAKARLKTYKNKQNRGQDASIAARSGSAFKVGGPTSDGRPMPKRDRYDSLILCSAYPSRESAGGEFVRARVNAYLDADHTPLVVEVSRRNKSTVLDYDDVECLRTRPDEVNFYLDHLSRRVPVILSHAPRPEIINKTLELVDTIRTAFWFHGAEVRDYRRMYFNHTTEGLETRRRKRDIKNRERLMSAARCFADRRVKKIFVSNYIRSVAEIDSAQKVVNGEIIHNYIDGTFYSFERKTNDTFKRILLIRSFEHENYANDIAIEAMRILSERPGFDELHFTISGFGALFGPLTNRVAHLTNVTVDPGHKAPAQMKRLHAQHGIFLAPSRHDTQGVTMGEAMASGLVCVTNRVAAIPEFADDMCAMLVRPNDPHAYAEAIWQIARDPALAESKSKAATKRVRTQCGFDETIAKELELIANLASAKDELSK